MVSWEVPYEPGRLEATGKKQGREVSRCIVETTGEPACLRLTPDRQALAGDGWDALPVTVEALDQDGRPVPTANLPVEFEITGPGGIIGLGNGDPNCHEPEKGHRRSLFHGLAQVLVQSQPGGSGAVVLRHGRRPAAGRDDDRRDRRSGTAGGGQNAAGLLAEVVPVMRTWAHGSQATRWSRPPASLWTYSTSSPIAR